MELSPAMIAQFDKYLKEYMYARILLLSIFVILAFVNQFSDAPFYTPLIKGLRKKYQRLCIIAINIVLLLVFGWFARGKVSLEHMALFRLPGESQDRYLLRELQIAAGMKHLQLLLDSVVVWGVVSLLMRHKRNSKQVIPDHHLGLCIIRMRLLFGICKDGA